MIFPKRGDIYWVNLDPTIGAEIKKTRPCVIISPDSANRGGPLIIVAPITKAEGEKYIFMKFFFLREWPIYLIPQKSKSFSCVVLIKSGSANLWWGPFLLNILQYLMKRFESLQGSSKKLRSKPINSIIL